MSKPRVSLIVAQATNGVIGRDNKMPWHLPEDLQYFKRLTMAKPIIMGRKTFESIGRVLPGRTNIVITRQPDWAFEGVSVAAGLPEAIALAEAERAEELMVIGGAQVYQTAMALADRVYLTQIHKVFEGDAWFPALGSEWVEVECRDGVSETDGTTFSFLTFDRVTNG